LGASENYEIIPSQDPVLLSSNNNISLVNGVIEFRATQGSEDITESTSFFVDDEMIEGNSFSSEDPGDFTVTAEYQSINSEPITINFHDGSQVNFKKRVLIEDYTGTWCGYCARIAFAVEEVQQNTENAVVVGIHRDSSNPNSVTYDPYNFDSSVIENNLEGVGYPKGYLNRNILWQSPEPQNVSQVLDLTQGDNPKLGLAMESEVTGNSVNLNVKVKIAKNFNNLKLVVYVLENGLIYEQKNYTNYFNAVNPIEGFEHNHVLRSVPTSLTGQPINMSEFTDDVYTKNFTFSVPASIENSENMEFVAFVINANGTAINVRKASTNEVQDFEQI
jgi:thiol-disulfide isomerase/thioredoxin